MYKQLFVQYFAFFGTTFLQRDVFVLIKTMQKETNIDTIERGVNKSKIQ